MEKSLLLKGRGERGCSERRRLGWRVSSGLCIQFTKGGFEGAVWPGVGRREPGVCSNAGCVITVSQGNQASTNRPGLRVAALPTLLWFGVQVRLGHNYGILLPHVTFSYFPGILDLGFQSDEGWGRMLVSLFLHYIRRSLQTLPVMAPSIT